MTLAIQYHNPGNLRITSDKWQGVDIAATEQRRKSAEKKGETGFFAFESPVYGIRAMVITMKTYAEQRQAKDGSDIDTVAEFVERWAPSEENDVRAYTYFLCQEMGLKPREHIDLYDWETCRKLVPAVIKFENGEQPYPPAVIEKALLMAGLHPPDKAMRKSRTLAASSVVAAGGVVSVMGELGPVVEKVNPVMTYLGWLPPWILPMIIVLGACVVVYARIDDRKKGLR